MTPNAQAHLPPLTSTSLALPHCPCSSHARGSLFDETWAKGLVRVLRAAGYIRQPCSQEQHLTKSSSVVQVDGVGVGR
ncbi:hypothetical protein GALMADRAFT_228378 [Galerina marginata CBS 339.88]|uniref:Uncharacterized protein n=1 Tax=Galerina marginata (strain CBS 339.88) TaxID=685588 RepID=A0A067ST86_GALM3|nr:hypothetical protein GALMADRAFT_228378 [Galerina marginata CBS 339.88]